MVDPAGASLLGLGDALDAVVSWGDARALGALACTSRAGRDAATRGAGARRWAQLAEAHTGGSAYFRLQSTARALARPERGSNGGDGPGGDGDDERARVRDAMAIVRALRAPRARLHWNRPAARALASSGPTRRLFARSGHSATLVEEHGLVVVAGGLMDHAIRGPGGEELSVLVVHLGELRVASPRVAGGAPPVARFRHGAARAPTGALHDDTLAELGLTRARAAEGALVVLHGGYDGDGMCFDDVLCLWTSPAGDEVRWAKLRCDGDAPPPLYHHTLTALRTRPERLVVIGGETRDEYADARFVYILDVAAQKWEKLATRVDLRERSSGDVPASALGSARWLHCAHLAPPRSGSMADFDADSGADSDADSDSGAGAGSGTGVWPLLPSFFRRARAQEGARTEGESAAAKASAPCAEADEDVIVIVGGYHRVGRRTRLAPMVPLALHVGSCVWRLPERAETDANTPPPRHRFATMPILGQRGLLVHGGCGDHSTPLWLSDAHVLDLRTLRWRPAPTVEGRPLSYPRVAGHTLVGGVAFAGCDRTMLGIRPVAKCDVLLVGEAPGGGAEAVETDDDGQEVADAGALAGAVGDDADQYGIDALPPHLLAQAQAIAATHGLGEPLGTVVQQGQAVLVFADPEGPDNGVVGIVIQQQPGDAGGDDNASSSDDEDVASADDDDDAEETDGDDSDGATEDSMECDAESDDDQ